MSDAFQFDSANLLWASGFFFLGVVVGIRLSVWWFTKVRPAAERIDADIRFLQAIPADDEPELPYVPTVGSVHEWMELRAMGVEVMRCVKCGWRGEKFPVHMLTCPLEPAAPPAAKAGGADPSPPATNFWSDRLGDSGPW